MFSLSQTRSGLTGDHGKQVLADSVKMLDPLVDSGWNDFVLRHPLSSVFHTREWLQSLHLTYGYRPIVFTTSTSNELHNGVVFADVRSWVTGRRLVSLPFSDHCDPLASGQDLEDILHFANEFSQSRGGKYIEIRPLLDKETFFSKIAPADRFSFHAIDLRPDAASIFRKFHDSCVRRKIKKAEREQLVFEQGNSQELLRKFRYLMLLTRRRHKLPPQPGIWFENLSQSFGDRLVIHMLSKDSVPIASILTISHKDCLTYKYGCSDAQFHNLGGMPLLFWKVIQEAKNRGFMSLDLGRSSPDDPGLVAFKSHLGGTETELKYFRLPTAQPRKSSASKLMKHAQTALAHLPDPVLLSAGRLLYRHLG